MSPLVDENADLAHDRLDIVLNPRVGESQNRETVQLKPYVPLPIFLETVRPTVFRPIDLNDAALVPPQQVKPYRLGQCM